MGGRVEVASKIEASDERICEVWEDEAFLLTKSVQEWFDERVHPIREPTVASWQWKPEQPFTCHLCPHPCNIPAEGFVALGVAVVVQAGFWLQAR